MLIIPIKDGENIDRALKRFKRKFDKTGAMRQLRARKQFIKPSSQESSKNPKSAIHSRLTRQRKYLSFLFYQYRTLSYLSFLTLYGNVFLCLYLLLLIIFS